MFKVFQTKTMQSQIDSVVDYIIEEFGNIDFAIEFLQEINELIDMLSKYPKSGIIYEPLSGELLKFTYRLRKVKNYKVFYTLDEENQIVYLAYIFHQKQNIEEQLE